MPAPRVLPKETCTAPRLSLVDNIDVAEDILDEARKRNLTVVEKLEEPAKPRRNTPAYYRKRLHLEGRGRNSDVEVRHYEGPCHPTALAMAEEIMARRGGYLHITGPCTVAVRNYPPEGQD